MLKGVVLRGVDCIEGRGLYTGGGYCAEGRGLY